MASNTVVPFWRAAGMSDITCSNLCANLVRQCLKEPYRSKALSRQNVMWIIYQASPGESFDFHERELETDESLWHMYGRWRSHHTVCRSIDEQHRHFNIFKTNAHYVHNSNKKDKPYKLGLNKFASMTSDEISRGFIAKHH